MEKLLTVEQASAVLNVHGETVRQWLRSGKLRGVKMGHRSWRVPEGALRELANTGRASDETTMPEATTSEATSPTGTLDDFLEKAEALHRRLDAAGFTGINGVEAVREARDVGVLACLHRKVGILARRDLVDPGGRPHRGGGRKVFIGRIPPLKASRSRGGISAHPNTSRRSRLYSPTGVRNCSVKESSGIVPQGVSKRAPRVSIFRPPCDGPLS